MSSSEFSAPFYMLGLDLSSSDIFCQTDLIINFRMTFERYNIAKYVKVQVGTPSYTLEKLVQMSNAS